MLGEIAVLLLVFIGPIALAITDCPSDAISTDFEYGESTNGVRPVAMAKLLPAFLPLQWWKIKIYFVPIRRLQGGPSGRVTTNKWCRVRRWEPSLSTLISPPTALLA